MPKFPTDFMDELLARSDIAEVVSRYLPLTRRSGANMFGLCPFHNEKTPSFSVNIEKQLYYCFGCHQSGGVVNFVMAIESLSYSEAVESLAKRAGLTVPVSGESAADVSRRNRLLDLNRDAARLFRSVSLRPEGSAALDYMRKRGISDSIAKKFGLGAAPDEWRYLSDAMKKLGYSQVELADAALIKNNKNGGIYDTFRNRLMFPVIDTRGYVVGFSGRALGDDEPKYLNSNTTPVYEKGRTLFGLNLAKKTKMGMLILVEGNIDVVALHQAGIDCAVAALGTALTDGQARLISRYTQSAVLAYDSDEAGVRATRKAIEVLGKAGVAARVLRISSAKDPDEYITKFGADAFKLLLDKSENHIEYHLRNLLEKSDVETDDGRLTYLGEAVKLLSGIGSAAEREVYGREVAQNANISVDSLLGEINAALRTRDKKTAAKEARERLNARKDVQPLARSLQYTDLESAEAEKRVISYLFFDPEQIRTVREYNLLPGEFSSPLLRKVYTWILETQKNGGQLKESLILAELEPDEASELARVFMLPLNPAAVTRGLLDSAEKIRFRHGRNTDDITESMLNVLRYAQRIQNK